MSTHLRRFVWAVLTLASAATTSCGESHRAGFADLDVSPLQADAAVESFALATDLPNCVPARRADVYYVESEGQLYYCDGRRNLPLGAVGAPGAPGTSYLVATSAASPAACPSGGVLLQVGPDQNRNNILDASEITSSVPVCNGSEGPAGEPGADGRDGVDGSDGVDGQDGTDGVDGQVILVESTTEPPGANCATGGVRLRLGADTNGNGLLDDSEVTRVHYVCDGEDVPPLPVCGNGVLEANEQCDDGNSISGDGCDANCSPTPPPGVVTCRALPLLDSGTCRVTPGDASLLIEGTVLAPGTVYAGGQVAIDAAGIITCVGCNCDAGSPTRVSCPRGVVSPGLINLHDHLTFSQNQPYLDTGERYEHRHDWRLGQRGHTAINTAGGASANQIRWGELRFLMGGATSTVGAGSASGFLRNLDVSSNQEGLGQPPVELETFPLGDTGGVTRTSDCAYPDLVSSSDISSLDAFVAHVAEGIDSAARNEAVCLSSTVNGGQDLLEDRTSFVHALGLRAADYAALANAGTGIVWSPRSNIALYGDTSVVTAAARSGVTLALGSDWIVTGSMNLLRELRCADSWNRQYLGHFFSDEQLWLMVTANAAKVAATDDAIGRLAPGLVADVAIFDGAAHPGHRAVIDADPEDVALVLRGGRALYGEAASVTALSGAACDAIDVCGAPKALCAAGDIGISYAALQAAVGPGAYPTFFCGEPSNEPSCVPERPEALDGSGVYTGVITITDADGDGILDGDDDCPSVFNPVRPVDNGTQADADADGAGDACDVCPLDALSTSCSAVDPNDLDADGLVDTNDNCPSDSNPEQLDTDLDGKGDVCDACPSNANPGAAACPASIYAIKRGEVPLGSVVALGSTLVTGRTANGFFLQVKASDAGYTGAEHSGIFVFAPGHAASVGDRISVTRATVTDFLGQLQLSDATIAIDATLGEAPPEPVVVTSGEVATGSTRATALESVIVRVHDVIVSSTTPETTVDDGSGALPVGNLLFQLVPPLVTGQEFESITGILGRSSGDERLQPRSAADYVFSSLGFPRLVALAPELASVPLSGSLTMTVTLSGPAQGDTVISLNVSDPSAAAVPANVTVSSGQVAASFEYAVLAEGVVIVTASLGADTESATVTGGATSRLLINEVDYDQIGSDTAEFVEIYNGGVVPVSLAGHALAFVNGSNGATYLSVDLSPAGSLAPGQFLVVGSASVAAAAGALRLNLPSASDNVQNGAPDGIALIDAATGSLVDALSYEGELRGITLVGVPGLVSLVEGLPSSLADSNTVAGSLCRLPDGNDSNDAASDWSVSATPTPGAQNL